MWWWLAAAWAVDCAPTSQAVMEAEVARATAALRAADTAEHNAIVTDFFSQLPCLDFPPEPELWAELLVGYAITEFASQGDWQTPLTTALQLVPDIERQVGPGHPIARFTAPPAPEAGEPTPAGVRLYVDGERASRLPAPVGLHLVQLRDGDGWRTVLTRDEPVPAAWLADDPLAASPAERSLFLTLSVVGGGSSGFLDVGPTVDFTEDAATTGASIGGALTGSAVLAGPLALGGELWAAWSPASVGVAGFLGPGLMLGPVELAVGPALQSTSVTDTEGTRLLWLPLPALRATLRTAGPWSLDASLGAGATAAAAAAWARAGLTAPSAGLLSWRAGVEARTHLAFLQAEEAPSQTATAGHWTVSAQLGLVIR